ncbi:MAG TPA: hypothetical protein VGS79_12500 [Puia sp.]|nr:hypothetical protein [Puia sp.]
MEALENEMKPSESLQLIMQVIGKTKENIKEHGYLFLLWGWLIASASILFFLLHTYTTFKLYFLPFPVLATIGIILTLVYYGRRSRSAETYLGYYLKKLWLVLGVSFILVVFINVVKGNLPFTYTMLIGGIGTLVSGLVLRFRPLTIGGVIFLAFTVASIFIAAGYASLLQGFAVIAGYLIPGYLLKYSKD